MRRKEIELKLELPPTSLPALKRVQLLRSVKARAKRTSEVSVYFDTDKHKLRKKGLMLRVRRSGSRHVQTIKLTGNSGPFSRDEWETEIAGETPDLDLARDTALESLVTGKLRRQLKPLFETRVRRTVYPVADDTHALALAVDRGIIDTGRRSMPLCEIALVLLRGEETKLFDLARELVQALPAELSVKSQSQRGYELLKDEEAASSKASRISLSGSMDTRDAFQAIGRGCLIQIVSNKTAIIKGDPEGVHQMRVGLRRLRAAMSLFADLLRDRQTASMKAELKWLAGQLGPARELDVLLSRVIAPATDQRGRWGGMPALSHELAGKREAALARAQTAVRSDRFRTLTLEITAWLETGGWRAPQDDLVRDRGALPIPVSAAEQLTRRWRKVRKKGKLLASLDAHSRHKLRIRVKKLRYAVEFFACLFIVNGAARRERRFSSALERLQDGLGDLNDIAVHEKRIATMAIRGHRPNARRAFAAGLLTGREDARIETAIGTTTEAYEDLVSVKPFWC